jgi:ABC-type transport system substrate-binding protein
VRPGFGFSPPSNEVLTAEIFRASLERVLSPDIPDYTHAMEILGDIEGAQAYHQGEADHVTGLAATGDTLTIRLVAPAPDFLERLAMPIACPVPTNTPVVPNGYDPQVPLPSAGPFYVSEIDGHDLAILLRNPNYGGSRVSPWNAIAIRLNLGASEIIRRVNSGEADVGFATNEPLIESNSDLARQWGPGSAQAEAGHQRLFVAEVPGVDFLQLLPRGILADESIRQAIGYAIDRPQIAAVYGEAPQATFLRAAFPSWDTAVYPVDGPDLAKAEALMNGRAGQTISMAIDTPDNCGGTQCQAIADAVQADLASIGINVEITTDEDPVQAASDPNSGIGMLYSHVQLPHGRPPDAADLLGSDSLGWSDPAAGWLTAAEIAEQARITTLEDPERTHAAVAFAQELVTEGKVIPFGGLDATMYASESIACETVPPGAFLFDLLALCPRT